MLLIDFQPDSGWMLWVKWNPMRHKAFINEFVACVTPESGGYHQRNETYYIKPLTNFEYD
jgi:hypothetical protein